MALALSIIGLLTPLVGLFVWWFRYKKAPTKDEKLSQLYDEKNDTMEHVRHLRDCGHEDEANQMVDRIRISLSSDFNDRLRND